MDNTEAIEFREELDTPVKHAGAEENNWKIIIVDDEQDVHAITELVLDDFNFDGKGIEFLNAFSAEEAKKLLSENRDIALMFLDVVMETEDAGLLLVKYVRETLKNNFIRIVLRTGQPGAAPENSVIQDYDINDYREKSEFTEQKLFTFVISSLRAYKNITQLDHARNNLENIVDERTSELQKANSNLKFEIAERIEIEKERENLIKELQDALTEVETLSGFIPICASCKKIRDDTGYWESVEHYIAARSKAQFTHSICPDCRFRLYPELYDKKKPE